MAIEAKNITKRFGDFVALDDVSVHVPNGSLTALLGPSGSGKSTLLRVIAGLEEADSGVVTFGDREVTGVDAKDRGVGFVFQHYAAFKHMSVRDNIAFGLKIRKEPKDKIKERVDELLALVHLTGWANRYPAQLSGGQRQRMALARALAVQPEVLLLDEPFGALDTRVREELREWLRNLHEKVPVTTIFVTHDQEEAMEVADQIVVVNEGHIEQAGSPAAVYERPASDFVMEFVGPVTKVADRTVRPHDLEIVTRRIDGSVEAIVQRIVRLGFEVRVELLPADGPVFSVQVTRSEADELDLTDGDVVWVREVVGSSLQVESAA
jgi:sulfate transport system ATP-binding protein